MGKRAGERGRGPKCIAIIGPFSSGKTTLLEAILARTGAIARPGKVGSGATVGDASAQARAHGMSVEATMATTSFMGEEMTFIDCPGSVEFAAEAGPVLAACDAAIVVTEADERRLPALQLILRQLDAIGLPRMLFLNKMDKATIGVRDTLKLLQPVSTTPLLLRQIALRKDGIVIGSIDLALERAYIYREHAESTVAAIPDDDRAREVEARFEMLERLADHDDTLMEQLLEEIEPPRDAIFDDLAADLHAGAVTPVLIGSAEKGNGVLRLLKAIRHDVPDIGALQARLGIDPGAPLAHVMKTIHTPHAGKLSVVRMLAGEIADGAELTASSGATGKMSGMVRLMGREHKKLDRAREGETVAFGRLDEIATGDTLAVGRQPPAKLPVPDMPEPVYAIAMRPRDRKDEVKLFAALTKMAEEDPSLSVEQNQEAAQTVVRGQGEMHLRVLVDRLGERHQIAVDTRPPAVPYRETIRKGATQRGRHRKQSGGHGQFGDVVLDVRPQPRGAGISFSEKITGGAVPRQYIPSVEAGVRDYLRSGPLGFPVVDVCVTLTDGSYHTVDSSDMAFQQAARLAMREAMAQCGPVLLEPVMRVEIATPSDATTRVTALVPQRRGQILGFDARSGWPGWDMIEATIPQAEIGSLIVDLRSATAGAASFTAAFDHLAELTGRTADDVVAMQGKAA